MSDWVLLLTPSRGRGGGIERYTETLEWAFTSEGIPYRRLDLRRPGTAGQAQLLADARRQISEDSVPIRVVAVHKGLLPLAWFLTRGHEKCGVSVVAHGNEIWTGRRRVRGSIEQRLMRGADTRTVAVSSYTAGALSDTCQASVLPPGLSREWFDALVGASSITRKSEEGIHLVTAFRLQQWQGKGLPELLEAVASLGRSDVHVTVCGSGDPSVGLRQLLDRYDCCSLKAGLSDCELAGELAKADLFVLATRTRGGASPSGEGFGLVLLEAQVAGTPVVAPAHGGSHDAYIEGVTGVAPTDESPESLVKVLRDLTCDPGRLKKMGIRAGGWARECFSPERYAALAISRLLLWRLARW